MIRFRCDCSCGHFLNVPDEFAGRPMRCPYSAGRIQVPRARLTEVAWLRSIDMQGMLQLLPVAPSPRKQRLIGVACCRRVWNLLDSALSRRAVEVVERVAEGLAAEQELQPILQQMRAVYNTALATVGGDRSALNTFRLDVGYHAALQAWPAGAAARAVRAVAATGGSGAAEGAAQSHLLRDILGNLFRPVSADPAWSAWHGRTARHLAQAIYDQRRFGDLPVLADALEEAGCDNVDILSHCRGSGPHVLGCWVVDLLLAKD
jgi:hypothetical protein